MYLEESKNFSDYINRYNNERKSSIIQLHRNLHGYIFNLDESVFKFVELATKLVYKYNGLNYNDELMSIYKRLREFESNIKLSSEVKVPA